MKATGIVRNIDHLGRCCLPKEIRRKMRLGDGDPVEFYVEGDKLVIKKYNAIGDLEHLMDDLEKNIHLMEPIAPVKKISKLLEAVKTMRRILAEK